MAAGFTQCPKCNSTDVFVSDGPGVGWDLSLAVSRGGGMYPTQFPLVANGDREGTLRWGSVHR